jgi:hydroxymethylglutaryl-CoA reductase
MKRLLAITGPTGIGKTAYVNALLDTFPFEVIDMDSCQVYAFFRVGTGRSDGDHHGRRHLYGWLSPFASLTVPSYVEAAVALTRRVERRGALPMFEGGSRTLLPALAQALTLKILALWPPADPGWIESRMLWRAKEFFRDEALVREVRAALRLGYGDTTLMRDPMIYMQTREYLEGHYTREGVQRAIVRSMKVMHDDQLRMLAAMDVERVEVATTPPALVVEHIGHWLRTSGRVAAMLAISPRLPETVATECAGMRAAITPIVPLSSLGKGIFAKLELLHPSGSAKGDVVDTPVRVRGSRIPGFGRLGQRERLARLAECGGLRRAEVAESLRIHPLSFEAADHMIENAIGVFGLPYGVGLNFRVNLRDRLVPMAVEEPSVVAAASYAARLVRAAGGFRAEADPPLMIGQIHVVQVPDVPGARTRLEAAARELLAIANATRPSLVQRGGGARSLEVRELPATACGPVLVVHLAVDVGDAMGANIVNSMAEALAPHVEALSGGEARLSILSNLADRRLARAWTRLPFDLLRTDTLDGGEVARRIVEAWALAAADPYRATTHNKGVMNGIDAVALATGNDWRGVEAGAHAWAARNGRYEPLTTWSLDGDTLRGGVELPLAVATVGGHLDLNPRARLSLRLLGAASARDLAAVMAAVGLGQNLAALRALVTEGIQRGHMALHARGLELRARRRLNARPGCDGAAPGTVPSNLPDEEGGTHAGTH